ncbi:hypothetical protein [Marivita sp.]|jgi:hypothetical protein|uniref:hypothetical protein n=1 Tax=Marivita sp. TaxID=2003365 RepID=UPI003F6BAE31
MPNETITKIIHYSFQLIAEANLSIGFVQGTGLGAVLLAMIAINFIRSRYFWRIRWVELVRAWREKP